MLSLKLGRAPPDSLSYRAAVSDAAHAMDKLASMKWEGDVLEMVCVAQWRVRGAAPRCEDERDHRRHVRERRGQTWRKTRSWCCATDPTREARGSLERVQ